MQLARSGALPPMPLAEHALEEANAVLDRLRAGTVQGRAILRLATV